MSTTSENTWTRTRARTTRATAASSTSWTGSARSRACAGTSRWSRWHARPCRFGAPSSTTPRCSRSASRRFCWCGATTSRPKRHRNSYSSTEGSTMSEATQLNLPSAVQVLAAGEAQIHEIENKMLQGIFACRSTEAVEASITFARFLSTSGITPENYPVFLQMLEVENHWVIDALIGDRDPFLLLSSVQPNRFIVSRLLAMMTRWHKGGIYHKNLSVILGVLQSVYSSARDGYRIYPLTIADLNAVGKHLDKQKGQDDPLNRAILELLEKISALEDAGDPEMEEVAVHASRIRNAFFDDRKKMDDIIPPVLLVSAPGRTEIEPRNRVPAGSIGSQRLRAATPPAEPRPGKED